MRRAPIGPSFIVVRTHKTGDGVSGLPLALPLTADIGQARRHDRVGPAADVAVDQ
jgi:hypothetical protein